MDVLGVHVRVSGNRYVAGFSLLQDEAVIDAWSLPSPAGDDAPRLAALHRYATDLLDRNPVDAVSIKGSESGSAKAQLEAAHAEGALLSAAGLHQVNTKVWTGPGYRGALGAKRNPDALNVAEADLSGTWPDESECQQAAAAALAAQRKPF